MPNIPSIKIGNTTYKVKDEVAREHLIEVSNTQPSSTDNRLWIKNAENEYQVPTYEEFSNLNSAFVGLTNSIVCDSAEKKQDFRPAFEQGDVNLNGTGFHYSDTSSQKYYRARVPENYTLILHPGDIIALSSYEGYAFYVGWYNTDKKWYSYSGWITSGAFEVTANGIYKILIKSETKNVPVVDLSNLLTITPAEHNEKLYNIDLIDYDNVSFGYLASSTGVETYSSINSLNKEMCSDFIEIEPSTNYVLCYWVTLENQRGWMSLCWYDSEKTFISCNYKQEDGISRYYEKQFSAKSPANAKYVRASARTYKDGVFSLYKYSPPEILVKPDWYTIRNKYHVTDMFDVKSINHTGYAGSEGAPENTLVAFVESKKHGFSLVETDLAMTKDGIPVLLHDNTIDRTSNGTGSIRSLTFEEVRQYDFGSYKDAKYAGTQIPSYEEFLKLCRELKLYPYVEIKYSGGFTKEEVRQIVEMTHQYGMADKVTYISFDPLQLSFVRFFDKKARLGLLTGLSNGTPLTFTEWSQIVRFMQMLRTSENSVFVDARKETTVSDHKSFIDDLTIFKENNIPVEVWTLYDTSYSQWFIKVPKYVTGFTTETHSFDEYFETKWGLSE